MRAARRFTPAEKIGTCDKRQALVGMSFRMSRVACRLSAISFPHAVTASWDNWDEWDNRDSWRMSFVSHEEWGALACPP